VKKGTQTCDEDTSGEYTQIGWASIGAIQIRRDRIRPVSTRMVPEPFCESIATFHQKDHISVLLVALCPVDLVGNAGDGEWVGFEWEVANGRKDDIGMLAWGPTSVKLQALSLSLLAAFGLFHFHNAFTFTLRPLCNSFQAFISLEIKVLDVMVKCPPRLYQRPNNNPHPNTPQVSPMHLVRIQKAPRATNREWVGYAL
jgi:hypothetical protein